MMNNRLEKELVTEIKRTCEHADRLAKHGETKFALTKYNEALNLLPGQKSDYNAATYIYSAIGELHWNNENYRQAGIAFVEASKCRGGSEPKIKMRIGQCLYKCGDVIHATDYLKSAFDVGGEKLFENEEPTFLQIAKGAASMSDVKPAAKSSVQAKDEQPVRRKTEESYSREEVELDLDMDYSSQSDVDRYNSEPDENEAEPENGKEEETSDKVDDYETRRRKWEAEWDRDTREQFENDYDEEEDGEYDQGVFGPFFSKVKNGINKLFGRRSDDDFED